MRDVVLRLAGSARHVADETAGCGADNRIERNAITSAECAECTAKCDGEHATERRSVDAACAAAISTAITCFISRCECRSIVRSISGSELGGDRDTIIVTLDGAKRSTLHGDKLRPACGSISSAIITAEQPTQCSPVISTVDAAISEAHSCAIDAAIVSALVIAFHRLIALSIRNGLVTADDASNWLHVCHAQLLS